MQIKKFKSMIQYGLDNSKLISKYMYNPPSQHYHNFLLAITPKEAQ